ncbi:Ion transport protein-domain-containing protein [Pisolithus tinctorius]|nr:Ion transport protein-domain-containing protein [Pisolithus tinctorius]
MRVANIRAQDASIRLPDDNEEEQEEEDWTPDDKPFDGGGQRHQSEALETHETLPLRGNTLGFLGPTNSFRLRLYLMLSHPYSDPILLVLILMTAVVLVIQASRTLLLPTDQSSPSPQVGYFHAWEDYALFVLTFFLRDIESLARICVSGSRFRSTSERTFFSRALRSDIPTSGSEVMALPFRLNIQFARQKLARNVPYLRQSWGRIDFIAVIAFWVAFVLASVGVERGTYHIGIFRALSVLRIARLLAITSGTTTIMHSLKVARPLLASVAYFVVFAVLLFSIIGVQSFKGSLRRNCYLLPTLGEAQTQLSTFCGSHINASTLQPSPYETGVKGYTCPLGQICQWSTVMYQTMGAEYFASCFFFVAGILVLNFWLFNLFVAVITNTFSAIRAETQKSAFGAAPLGFLIEEQDEGWPATGRHSGQNALNQHELIHQEILYKSELFLAIAFDTEILIRIAAELPAWRVFFRHGNNWIDLVLAIGSSVIQIPAIQQSEVYPWLTIFPIARFYRVILEFPRMKPLLLTVFGNLYALVAIQLLQGDMSGNTTMNFGQLWNSFLAVYQVLSSENWTTVLYDATVVELPLGQAVIVATFISCWLLFANFIIMQMFIAVINENFSVAEEAKKEKQASNYWARHHRPHGRLNPYQWFKADPVTVKSVVQGYSPPRQERKASARHVPSKSITMLQRLFMGTTRSNEFPLIELHAVEDDTEQYLEILAGMNQDDLAAEALDDAIQERRAHHPTYDKTFWLFSQRNGLRRLCQKIVEPAGGERIFGTAPDMVAHTIFQLLVFLTVIGGIATFGFALFLEFLIKVVADGLLFTPNAYARSMMRSTFENLIISGVVRILDAAILAILYLIPFSVWGTNIFAGLMNECNDTSVQGISDCNGEYVNTIYGNSYGYLVPRAWNNPSPSTTFSFDNFRASMLILFEIVSLEGWIDVMSVAMSITGAGQQPQTNASQAYALFFLIYNLLGGAVILTLFVSIIISNFSSKTGSAFLTRPQREWIDLEKLIKRQKSSKRPYTRPTSRLRAWCYDSAVRKHGWWSRGMTLLFVMQIMDFSLFSTSIYMLDIIVRFYGLGWESFRDNGWNIFDVIVASGSFTATIIVQFGSANPTIQQLQKLFLVCISFKLVQRVDSLNQLASLPVILNLLGLWLVVFLFFAIMYLEVFGMTKWFSGESNTQNYQSMGSALLMLEGWNQYMHDYATVYPRCTYTTGDIAETDCGSTAWAFSLFIAWNLLSMYIILNMFTGVVVENFSYVFQSTGGAKSITRREMRSFKKVWAEFSNAKTGQLERQNIGPFLARLDGVFETRIYPREQSVGAILAGCRDNSKRATVTGGVNLKKLNNILNKIDHSSVRKRRNTYGRLYHEAHIVSLRTGGLSFTDMLLLLAHHKLIDDREALVLRDLVVRQETNKLVTDLVNLDRVRSLLRMISQRRKYLLEKEQVMNRDIPAIFVNSSPATPPPIISRDITSPRSEYETGQSDYEASSPTPSPRILVSSSELPTADRSFRSSLQRARRVSDVSMLSADMSQTLRDLTDRRERSRSPEPEDEGDMISSMQRSIWGEMMLQAAREEGDA